MATAKKNPNGTWSINIYVGRTPDGRKICKHLTARTKKEVETKALEILSNKKRAASQLTVSECFDRYIETRRPLCKPRTIRDYIMNQTAFPELLQLHVADLTDDVCQAAIDRHSREHSPKTTVDRWHYLQTAVQYFEKSFHPQVRLPIVRRKRLEFPDASKFQDLFLYVKDRNVEIPVLLGATCGLRRAEIAALDLENDIDYRNGFIRISKSMALNEHNEYVISTPKTEAGNRTVVCPAWVLERIRANLDRPDFIQFKPNTITTKWHKLSVKFGIGCSFHGLRHYFASAMEAEGVPWAYQKKMLGHTTNYMLNRYQEYLRQTSMEMDARLAAHMDALNPFNNLSTKESAQTDESEKKQEK